VKQLPLLTLLAVLTSIPGADSARADACSNLTITGHSDYPPIGYKDGEHIAGAGATLVQRIADELKIPVQSEYTGSWEKAVAAARDGKVDIIVGIYLNDERATYLSYVRPAFTVDTDVVIVPKGKAFPFRGREDLVGKRGVTNAGESYGSEFDGFMAQKLTVARSNGVDQAFKDLLSGKADYMIVGQYPGLNIAAQMGVTNQIELLKPPLLKSDMFIAFSKKSPCLGLTEAFGRRVGIMRASGAIETIMQAAIKTWDSTHGQ